LNPICRATVLLLALFLLAIPPCVAQQLAISGMVDDANGVLPEVNSLTVPIPRLKIGWRSQPAPSYVGCRGQPGKSDGQRTLLCFPG
jgi:hypothetical protein